MPLEANSQSDPRARPKPFAFYPPKTSPFWIRLAQKQIKRSIRRKLRVTDIDVSDDDLARLRLLRGQRVLLTPSHSGGFEPHIVMYLSKLLKDEFNFVAAVELFEQSPINRWLMPRLGVYSIIRGAVDRSSFSMTRQLLAAGERWLVIFPEGQSVFQNDLVIPFQQGVFQLAFKAYEDAAKMDADAHLYCVPLAIKYVFLEDMHAEIDASMSRLEGKLALPDGTTELSRYARLRWIVEAIVVANEKAHRIKPDKDASLNDRIQSMKLHVVGQLEAQLGITPPDDQALLDRLRTLFNTVDRVVYEEPPESEYEQQLAAERQQAARGLYDDLWRLLQFVAIYDGYLRESMTFERFLDSLCLAEMEVFKERRFWGPRKACLKVGEPIDLRDRAAAYQTDKRAAVRDIALELEDSIRAMLESLGKNCQKVDDAIAAS